MLNGDETLAEWRWEELFDAWWSTTHALQTLRDNPGCAEEEREATRRFDAPGLRPKLKFDPAHDIAAPYIATGARPKVAILREQGVNSQIETAMAFDRAGFDAFDVHMSDLIAGRARLGRGALFGVAAAPGSADFFISDFAALSSLATLSWSGPRCVTSHVRLFR